MINTYDDFVNFFDEYPRYENLVYSKSENGKGKEGYRGKGYQVIIEREDWDKKIKKSGFLESCMRVIFRGRSGEWDGPHVDGIVRLIIDDIAEWDLDFYQEITDETWFQANISDDYACIQDLYCDYEYNEKKFYDEIQSGKYKSYDDYIHHLAKDYVSRLKESNI